jgi:hypothetical protein
VRWRCADGHEFESGEDLSTKRGHRFRRLELGDSDLRYERTVCRKPLVRVEWVGRGVGVKVCDGCWPDPPPSVARCSVCGWKLCEECRHNPCHGPNTPDCTHRVEPLEPGKS